MYAGVDLIKDIEEVDAEALMSESASFHPTTGPEARRVRTQTPGQDSPHRLAGLPALPYLRQVSLRNTLLEGKIALAESDASLIRRAKGGDASAFGEIYERYQPSVYSYIYYRVGNHGLAEELTADVFVRLVDRVESIRNDEQPLLAWLYTVARNLAIDSWRRTRACAWQPLDEAMAAPDSRHPSSWPSDGCSRDALVKALEELTEPQRQVVLLKFIEGMSNAEIGTLIGRDEGAVKSLQHRGARRLAAGIRERWVR